MLDALEGTPLWVYGAFLLVCYYGLSARKTSRESQRSLIITPVVLVVWSLLSLSYADRVELTVGSWVTGMLLGGLVAFALFPRRGLTLDEEGKHLIVPGTWKVLGISLLFFCRGILHRLSSCRTSRILGHCGNARPCWCRIRVYGRLVLRTHGCLLLGVACTSRYP